MVSKQDDVYDTVITAGHGESLPCSRMQGR